MAYPLFRVEGSNPASTSCVVTLPPHVAGQHLIVMAAQDNGATAISASGSWTSVVTQGQSGACRGAVFRLEATGSAETLTLSSSTNAPWAYVAIVLPDVLSATPVDGWQRTDWNASSTADTTSVAASSNSGSAIEASEAGCLALVMWCSDSGGSDGPFMRAPLSDMIELGRVAENGISLIVGYRQIEGSGAIPTFRMQSTVSNEGGNGIVVLLRNSVSGSRAPDCRTGESVFRYYGQFGNQDPTTTWITPNDSVTPANGITGGAQIDGLDVNTAAGSYAANQSLGPWGLMGTMTLTQNTAGSWCGMMHTCASTDMSGKVLSVEHSVGVTSAVRFGEKGNIVVFKDGAGAWVAYTLARRAVYTAVGAIFTTHIALGEAVELDSSGTMDWSDVQAVALLQHRQGSATGANNIHFRNVFLWDVSKIVQGGAARPANWGILPRAMNQWGCAGLVSLQGGAQILGKTKLQIGETTETTYWNSSDYSLELPPEYQASPVDPLTSQPLWNVNANAAGAGIILKPSANDAINLNAGVMRTAVRQALTVDASASTSAAVSMAGQSVIGFAPTWKTGVPVTGATFKDCAKIDFKGATVTNTTVSETTATDAVVAFTETGGSMTGCTTDVTGTSAAYHIEVGDGGTGDFALTLANHTFTGSAGTDKVHVTNTSGTTTITIAGTTALVDADVTSEGATVVIAAPQPTLDATVLEDSRSVLYNDTTDAELDNTAPAGTTWSKEITSGATIGDQLTLHVFKEGYKEFKTSFLYSGQDTTLLVTQEEDPAIQFYRTTLGVTDYTTLTEFNFYAPDIYIQSDDPDGASALMRVFTYYNGILTTEDGARYLRGAVTFKSPFDVVINRSVVPMAVDNVSVTHGLYFTDEAEIRITTDDGTSWIAPPSAPGSIRYAFGVSPGQIETGVSGLTGPESAKLMALPSADTIWNGITLP